MYPLLYSRYLIMSTRHFVITLLTFVCLTLLPGELKMSHRNFRPKKRVIMLDKKDLYNNNSFNKYEHRITDGTAASIAEYPYAVRFFNDNGLCGGAILNSWTIITSAHCLEYNTDTELMEIEAGTTHLYSEGTMKHKVNSFVIHEEYDKDMAFACDIALLFLEEPLKLGGNVKKGILVNNDKWKSERNQTFIVTGWGWTKYDGTVSKHLMMGRMRYVSKEKCLANYSGHELSEDMFCLGKAGDSNVCRGDSGGGVLWDNKLVGLTSHGDQCVEPSVFTSLWYFRKWIKKQVLDFIARLCK